MIPAPYHRKNQRDLHSAPALPAHLIVRHLGAAAARRSLAGGKARDLLAAKPPLIGCH